FHPPPQSQGNREGDSCCRQKTPYCLPWNSAVHTFSGTDHTDGSAFSAVLQSLHPDTLRSDKRSALWYSPGWQSFLSHGSVLSRTVPPVSCGCFPGNRSSRHKPYRKSSPQTDQPVSNDPLPPPAPPPHIP